MDLERTADELKERKVVRRGLLAGLATLSAAAMMKVTGTTKAEAGVDGDLTLAAVNVGVAKTTLNSSAVGGSGYSVLRVENFRIADAIEAVGGPGSLGNAGQSGVVATGGNNTQGSNALPSAGGAAIIATGGNTTGGVGNGGVGVQATGGGSDGATGGTGVQGTGGAPGGTGVRGFGGGTAGSQGHGVHGSTNSSNSVGVMGVNGGAGSGVRGTSVGGPGVDGVSTNSLGIRGTSTNFVGIVGISTNNHGLYGSSSSGAAGYGIVAENLGANGPGLLVTGSAPSQIFGGLQVFGVKNAIIRMQDGTLASVYCQESPEPYFEDFGRAQLVGGVAYVPIEREFATLVAGGDYMVFCFPEGPAGGLYVSRRTPTGFEVRDTTASNISFTYRIVTKRKDIEGKRFARVSDEGLRNLAAMRAQAGVTTPATLPNGPSLPPAQPVAPPTNTTVPQTNPVVTSSSAPGLTVVQPGPAQAP